MESETDRSRAGLTATPQPALLKMRCPSCQKLYSVHLEQFAAAAQPKFQCIGCQTKFSAALSAQGEVETSPVVEAPVSTGTGSMVHSVLDAVPSTSMRERAPMERAPLMRAPISRVPTERVPVSEFRCPKCGSRNALSSSECRFCGVVFAKYKPEPIATGDDLSASLGARRDLALLWDEVVARYDEIPMHEKFVKACNDASCLAFAAQKYGRILSASPTEEIARTMQNRVKGFASFPFETAPEKGKWQFRVPKLNTLILILGGAAMVMGFMIPSMKSLAGVGFSAIALAVGVRYFLRPQP